MAHTTENVVTKTMGAVKDAKAVLKGLTGVFRHLMEEHGKVGALMKRVSAAANEDIRRDTWPAIRTELLSHENGEVNGVYSSLALYPELASMLAVYADEPKLLEDAVRAVDALSFQNDAWQPTFELLLALVLQHFAEEESELFPKAQRVIGKERAKALVSSYEAAKRA